MMQDAWHQMQVFNLGKTVHPACESNDREVLLMYYWYICWCFTQKPQSHYGNWNTSACTEKASCVWDMNIHYDYVHQTYNGTYIEVCHSKQRTFGHKITSPHWSMRDQRVEKMNNWSVESWITEVNHQLYAVTESYKTVETILEQLRPFLIHAKRKKDLRMIQ